MEAVQVTSSTTGVTIRCQAHVSTVGWMPVVNDGDVCGTTGRGLRLEAVRFWAVANTAEATLSTVATAGDFNTGTQSQTVLQQMGQANPNLVFLLGDISQSATKAQPLCDLVHKYIDDPFGWVQGNHDVLPDSDGPVTADYLSCLPKTPHATGTPAVEQVISIPGARIITASPHLDGSNYDRGSAGLARISAAIDAAQAAGDFPIIAIHRPHYTVGLHGTSGTQSKAISELAITKGVKLVLNGHDHNYSRIVMDGTTFVTVGTGGHGPRALDPDSNRWPITVKAYPGTPGAYGWLELSVTQNSITGAFIGTHGPDTFTLLK
jgi:predicted phosphodiesterase